MTVHIWQTHIDKDEVGNVVDGRLYASFTVGRIHYFMAASGEDAFDENLVWTIIFYMKDSSHDRADDNITKESREGTENKDFFIGLVGNYPILNNPAFGDTMGRS